MLRNGRIVIAIRASQEDPAGVDLASGDPHRSPPAREPLDGQDHDQDEDHQDDRQGRGQADLPLEERQDVDLDAGDGRGVARSAAGRDVDDVERRQGGDHGDRDADADLVPQARHRDRTGTPGTTPRRRSGPTRTGRCRSASCRSAAGPCRIRAGPRSRSARPPAARSRSRRARPRVTSPRPIAVSAWLIRPFSDSSRPQMIPAATSGMTWGRKRTVRDTVPSRPVATRWMTLAVTRPRATGMRL